MFSGSCTPLNGVPGEVPDVLARIRYGLPAAAAPPSSHRGMRAPSLALTTAYPTKSSEGGSASTTSSGQSRMSPLAWCTVSW